MTKKLVWFKLLCTNIEFFMNLYPQKLQKLHYLTNQNKSVVRTHRKFNGERSFVFGTMIWLFLCRFLTYLRANRIREIVLDTM